VEGHGFSRAATFRYSRGFSPWGCCSNQFYFCLFLFKYKSYKTFSAYVSKLARERRMFMPRRLRHRRLPQPTLQILSQQLMKQLLPRLAPH
jgi:hypothetical protein